MKSMVLLAAAASVASFLPVLAQEPTAGPMSLSLQDCVGHALRKNLDIRYARFGPGIAKSVLRQDYAGWDPRFSLGVNQGPGVRPGRYDQTTGLVLPGQEGMTTDYNSGLQGLLPSGLTYTINSDYNKNSVLGFNTNGFPSFSPNYNSSAGINLSQPLLKNFWIDSTRLSIQLDKNKLKRSEQDVRFQIITSATATAKAYYDLISAIENVKVQEAAVALAERLLAENKKRVEVGALAPLDVQDAQAQLATSQANLFVAQGTLGDSQNHLKALINDDYTSWDRVEIVPTESLAAIPEAFDKRDSWTKSLAYRPDVVQAKIDLENQKIQIKFNRNQMFPELDLVGSYALNGYSPFLHDSFDQIYDRKFQTYSYGLKLSMPLGNINARENLKQAKLTLEQLLIHYKQVEQAAIATVDIDVRAAKTALERVDATKQARIFSEASLDAEQKKLENGKSTSYLVLQKQRDLTLARSTEIQSLTDYNKALYTLLQDEGYTLQKMGITLEVK
jgi:outer membrane protein TolC